MRRIRGSDHATAARGQVLALFALFLIVLLGFTAIAVDYGTYLLARREYQNVADAGAIAGAAYMTRPLTPAKEADARAAAWEAVRTKLGLSGTPNEAQLNAGWTEGEWTVWVSTPASDAGADYLGDSSITGNASVYVRVQKPNPSFLGRFFNYNGRTIRGWATAGNLPSRWAVLALCPRNGDCPSSAESVALSGTNTVLKVIEGDLGSNWGLKINSNAADRLQLPGDSQAYLEDITCGASRFLCYPNPNVSDGSGTGKRVRVLPDLVQDPNYPEPSWIDDGTAVPWRGNGNNDVNIPNGSGTVQNATGADVDCSPTSPRIGPGRYRDIDIDANSCVVFDPTYNQAAPGTPLPLDQRPGIYVITRNFDIGNDSFVIGDGVTIFWTNSANPFNPSGGIVVNQGNDGSSVVPANEWKYGAWTTLGNPTWTTADGVATPAWITPASTRERGIAFYVRRASGSTHTAIFNMSGTSPLMFKGILYGPTDNVNVSGAGSQAAVGQIIGWTVGYNGNTTITQLFDGPDDARAYLLEPRTGQTD